MELADIQRQALAARQFSAQQAQGRVSVTLQLPTRHETQLGLARAGGSDDTARLLALDRLLLVAGVVAWSGVLIRDVLPEHPNDDPLPFEPAAVPLLLDAQPDWAAAWSAELFARLRTAREKQEAAEKN